MKKYLSLSIASLFALTCFSQRVAPLLVQPALSPDGSQIAFSYQGDIWTVPATGGRAQRLTIHESYESNPQWSYDGSQIAFQGNRFGNSDLFVMQADGGEPQRLTYHSTSDYAPRWTPEGHLWFNTRRAFAEVEREAEIYTVPATGGTPSRALDALGFSPAPSPDGRLVAFERGNCRIAREAYRGSANRDIWLYDRRSGEYRALTTFDGQDFLPVWGGNTLFYLSARSGRYNLFAQEFTADGQTSGEPRQLTSFADMGIRHFDVSANGALIVFSRGVNLYTLPTDGGEIRQLDIQVTHDQRFDPVEHKTFTDKATEYALSPNGKYLAFGVRGELFLTQNDKEKSRTVRLTDHPYRDQGVAWLNDSTLLFLSDRFGNNELFLVRSADTAQADLFKTLKRETIRLTTTPEEEESIELSPDRRQIAVRRGRGHLLVADIDQYGALTNERTLLDGWATPGHLSWSPDSRWLAYDLSDLNFNREIYIQPVDNSRPPANVSLHPRSDDTPVWSPDGSKLGFLSIRNNGDADVWFVWLRRADWEKTRQDWEEEDEEEPAKNKKKDDKNAEDKENGKEKEEKKVDPIEIDFDDIHERLEQVTRLPGNEGDLAISKDGETFFFTTNGGDRSGRPGDPELKSVKWNGKDLKTLQEKATLNRLQLDAKGNNLYFIKQGGSLGRIGVDGGKLESLPFSARMDIDHPQERQQIFDEAWRSLEAGFYDPDFHGQNWRALREQYEPIAMAASTSQDFRDVFNEMLGQINASHMGMYGSDPEETQREQTGLLGLEVTPGTLGVRITRVIPRTPADRTSSKLEVGERILSVNGEAIEPPLNFYRLLNGTVDERILLEVQDAKGATREVVIRPTASLSSELYQSWVDERRRLTDEYSGGRLGYLHIQGMNWTSFERFERELMASGQGKEGIVIDVRFNGGGWTTDMLMAVLNVRQHSYTIPRGATDDLAANHLQFREYYPFGERLPLSSWTKPSVALCNHTSYSNAEIFSHAYKTLDIGKLVGEPTFGAVISTGSQGLIDGSFVRMPFRGWYVKATGENMEHGPAVPDVILYNEPDGKAKGQDLQLKTAVELLLQEIDGR